MMDGNSPSRIGRATVHINGKHPVREVRMSTFPDWLDPIVYPHHFLYAANIMRVSDCLAAVNETQGYVFIHDIVSE